MVRSCPKAVHRAFYFPFFPLHSFPMHALNSSHSRQSPSMLHPYSLRSMHACPCLVPEPRLLFCSKFGGETSGTRVERGAADRSTKPPSRSATAILYALRNMRLPHRPAARNEVAAVGSLACVFFSSSLLVYGALFIQC